MNSNVYNKIVQTYHLKLYNRNVSVCVSFRPISCGYAIRQVVHLCRPAPFHPGNGVGMDEDFVLYR